MRTAVLFMLMIGLWGCASARSAPDPVSSSTPLRYIDAPVAVLAFNPPSTLNQPLVLLPREERYPSAFVGFEDVTTFSYTRTDDRGNSDGGNYMFRQAISERIGVSYR